jgi:ubiquinone/menaquinone biosynthesis C-methylase UbiE
MVQKARVNTVRARLGNVRIYETDMANLPPPDSCADVVISNGAINLVPEKRCALREAFRVLKLGGRFQIADMIRDEIHSTMRRGDRWVLGQLRWRHSDYQLLSPDAC